jgi:hypothetical protein
MDLNELVLPLLGVGGALFAAYVSLRFYERYYQSVPPNRALVLYGGSRSRAGTSGNRSVELRQPRIVVGGGVFVPPWRHGSESLSLTPVDAEARVLLGVPGADGEDIGWEVHLTVQVKIPAEPRMLAVAAENLLGRSEAEIRVLVIREVEAIAPAVVYRELSNKGEPSWDHLAAEIQAAVAPELVALGLEVRTLSVTQLRRLSSHERGDAAARAAPNMSRELLWASGDLGVRLRAMEVRSDRTERSLGILGAEVMRIGRDGSKFPELPALQPYDSTGEVPPSRSSARGVRNAKGEETDDTSRPLLDAEE